MRPLALFSLLTALVPWAVAQRAASVAPAHAAPTRPASPRFNSPTASFAFGREAHPSRFHRPSPLTSLLFPIFGDAFNPDDIYSNGYPSNGYPVASEPPTFLLQLVRDMAGPAADSMGPGSSHNTGAPPSNRPLMIELQGDRYVKVNTTAVDGEALPLSHAANVQPAKSTRNHATSMVTSNSANTQGPMIAAASPAHDLPPAVLVFRDGHSEEVRDYTIADGSLYARGDYYTDGYWNKKIDLSTLNVAQTLQANADRNVKFILPSSPNEVITRP